MQAMIFEGLEFYVGELIFKIVEIGKTDVMCQGIYPMEKWTMNCPLDELKKFLYDDFAD